MSFTAEERAQVLAEALPYIRRFSGRTLVIKIGGKVLGGADTTLTDLALLHFVGVRLVLVHGGGAEISAWQRKQGVEPTFVAGLRVTDAATMEMVKMVLTGKINPELVASLNRHGVQAVGMSGEDGATVIAEPRLGPAGEDLGLVGAITQVNPEPLHTLIDRGYVPVVASVAMGYDGNSYNVNADSMAADLTVALDAARLVLLTDVNGLRDQAGALVPEVRRSQIRHLIDSGVATGGMVPKLEACARALDGASGAHIIDGTTEHALLLELLTEQGIGTMVLPDQESDNNG
ncbi:MAG: acetylglutamate kinase [Candidatus Dormibacteria bacterium]